MSLCQRQAVLLSQAWPIRSRESPCIKPCLMQSVMETRYSSPIEVLCINLEKSRPAKPIGSISTVVPRSQNLGAHPRLSYHLRVWAELAHPENEGGILAQTGSVTVPHRTGLSGSSCDHHAMDFQSGGVLSPVSTAFDSITRSVNS